MEMENICKIKRACLSILIFAFTLNLFSQDQFYVNKFEGIPYLEINDSIKPITRGMLIKKEALLTLNNNDVVHFINKEGNEYILDEIGSYSHSKLLEVPVIEATKPYMKTFLSYTWRKFTNRVVDNRSRSGVVFRGDEALLMLYPVDSAKVIGAEVSFKWNKKEGKEKNYYLILKDINTNKTTILGTPATSLTILVNDSLLKADHSYEWAITENKYQSLKKTTFYSFHLMTEAEFKSLNKDIKPIIAYLKQEGLSRSEIRTTLCEVYKICQ